DHLGGGAIATDWGSRILSDRSALYDPLSYHYGSVWPLFTGWSAVGAYRYGRPLGGFQALMANALLTYTGALGDVTELLSGDCATPLGRSSHHQIWSEAMVVSPLVRGLLGLEAADAGRTLRFAPALPAAWDRIEVRGVRVGSDRFDFAFERDAGRAVVRITPRGSATPPRTRIVAPPAFPLDGRMRRVTVNGRDVRPAIVPIGDIQRVEATLDAVAAPAEVVFSGDAGTEMYIEPQAIQPGADNRGLRALSVRADGRALRLVIEGRGGRAYRVSVRTPRRLGAAENVAPLAPSGGLQRIELRVPGRGTDYIRREGGVPVMR